MRGKFGVRPLTADEVWHARGMTHAQMGERYGGITKDAVGHWCRKLGYTFRRGTIHMLTAPCRECGRVFDVDARRERVCDACTKDEPVPQWRIDYQRERMAERRVELLKKYVAGPERSAMLNEQEEAA